MVVLAYSDLGQVEQAIKQYEQALDISREIGDRRNEGVCLENLGNAYRDLGQVERAKGVLLGQMDLVEIPSLTGLEGHRVQGLPLIITLLEKKV